MKTTLLCRCGSVQQYQIGNVTHTIAGKTIIIHDIPHYYCSFCKKITYDAKVDVVSLLKYAFRNQWEYIEYSKGEYI